MIFIGLVFVAGGLGGCAFFLKAIAEENQRRNDLYEKVHLSGAQPSTPTQATAA